MPDGDEFVVTVEFEEAYYEHEELIDNNLIKLAFDETEDWIVAQPVLRESLSSVEGKSTNQVLKFLTYLEEQSVEGATELKLILNRLIDQSLPGMEGRTTPQIARILIRDSNRLKESLPTFDHASDRGVYVFIDENNPMSTTRESAWLLHALVAFMGERHQTSVAFDLLFQKWSENRDQTIFELLGDPEFEYKFAGRLNEDEYKAVFSAADTFELGAFAIQEHVQLNEGNRQPDLLTELSKYEGIRDYMAPLERQRQIAWNIFKKVMGVYFNPKKFERNGVYEKIGVRKFQRLYDLIFFGLPRRWVDTLDVLSDSEKREFKNNINLYRLGRTENDFKRRLKFSYGMEALHIYSFIFLFSSMMDNFNEGDYLWAIFRIFFNIFVNVYPIMSQRYLRGRIQDFLEKKNNKNPSPDRGSAGSVSSPAEGGQRKDQSQDSSPAESRDKAMLGTDEYGGIDFNPANLNLSIDGNGLDLNTTFDNNIFQNRSIDGFQPVIINVAPITNLQGLIGLDKSGDKKFIKQMS